MRHHRVVVLGSNGQLAKAILSQLGTCGIPLTRHDADIENASSLESAFNQTLPSLVMNCAAYNFVDRAESEPEVAFRTNGFGPRLVARLCQSRSIPLMHISTDHVFGQNDQTRMPWTERKLPEPKSVYAISKRTGEDFVRAECEQHFVVRTCGLYGTSPAGGKGNFVETMLRLAAEKPVLRVVSDQWCTPTNVDDLAAQLLRLAETGEYGLYHATNSGATNWCEFARHIVKTAGFSTPVEAISTNEYPAAACRPSYSVLDTTQITNVTGLELADWSVAVERYIKQKQAS